MSTLGRSQDVCKGSWLPVEGERCVVSSSSLVERFEVHKEEEKFCGVLRDLEARALLKRGSFRSKDPNGISNLFLAGMVSRIFSWLR